MQIKRTSDLKAYILRKYSFLDSRKFDIVKIGARVYMYYVNKEGNLARSAVFHGCLPTLEGVPKLQEAMDRLIDYAVKEWQGVNN